VRLIPSMRAIHHESVTLGHSPDYFVYLHRNRVRYALRHLEADQWFSEFVPYEFRRIRHELARLQQSGESQRVGAEAIDMLLRDMPALSQADAALPLVPDFPDERICVEELEGLRAVAGKPIRSRAPLLGGLRNLVNDLGPRHYVDAALAEQRAFNDAVVRAFELQRTHNARQQQLNREQTAAMLTLALVVVGRLYERDDART
jgi:hypothetical protein